MSPDDILAANLWPWPDPLIKRDREGRLIFVNAAFLQLYGGRVEDWFGRAVTGWPTPNHQGPQRFETRTGDAPDQTIYDWVETVMADGNTMAIARDVTIFMTRPAAPAPKPATQAITPPTAAIPAATAAVEPAPSLAPLAQSSAPSPTHSAPIHTSPPHELASDFADTLNNDAEDYQYDTQAEQSPAPVREIKPEAIAPSPVNSKEKEERRMIERRALPIEDSTTVLGSNWRDQVIAKAIGEEIPEAKTQTPNSDTKQDAPDNKKIGEGLHILLAEDNAINALLTRTLLEADGASVETVEDGSLAVHAVQSSEYDLIFMDMRMPVMDGLESTRKIRALGKTMPIIALTANAFDDDRNACFDSGMNDFMTKPVSAEELSEMVATWVRNKDEDQKLAS